MRRVLYTFAVLSILATLTLYLTRREWLWIEWNPRYSLDELKGLHSSEVIAKLGAPSFDPRVSTPDGKWDEQRDGPFYLSYYGSFGATCVIQFKENKADEVRRFGK